jgi:hypothetical protein
MIIQNSTVKKILLTVLVIFSISVIKVLTEDYYKYNGNNRKQDSNNLNQETFSEFLAKTSIEINKRCPMVIDSDTRLDNTIVLSQNTLQYNYTWVNMEKGTTDIGYIEKNFAPIVIENVKTNPGLKMFRDRNVTLSYYYKDKNGKFVYLLKITPKMYK